HAVRSHEHGRLLGIVFAEIDGLADVAIGFAPTLPALVDLPGRQLETAFAHLRGRGTQELDPGFDTERQPRRLRGLGRSDRLLRFRRTRDGKRPDNALLV